MTCVNSRVLYDVKSTKTLIFFALYAMHKQQLNVSWLLHNVKQKPGIWGKMAWCCKAHKIKASMKIRYVIVTIVPAGCCMCTVLETSLLARGTAPFASALLHTVTICLRYYTIIDTI